MTVVTNIRLRSSYNTIPSDQIQQIASGLPIITNLTTYQALSAASIIADKSMTGGYRLSISGKINGDTDLMFWYVKNNNQIDFSCPVGWWCGTPPGYFTYTQDFIDNIAIGDKFEVFVYFRYMGTNSVTINDFTIKYSDVQQPQLYAMVSECKNNILSGNISEITVHVIDDTGTSVDGADISLSAIVGSIDPISGTTDANGYFISTYTGPTVTSSEVDTITAIVSKSGYIDGSGLGQITISPIIILTSVDIVPSTPSVIVGQDLILTAIPRDQNGNSLITGINVNWNSSDETKATVTQTGITTTLHGVSVSDSPIIVTVSATDGTNIVTNTTTATVTPIPPILTSIEVSPSSASMQIGRTQQFTAICRDQYSSLMTCPTIIWNIIDSTKGSISITGLFTGISEGTTIVTATNGNIVGNASVIITPMVQAGFGNIGMLLTAGLLFGLLISKKCKDNKTKEECEKDDCQWKKDKCTSFTKEQKSLINALREEGAIGVAHCKDGECRIDKFVAEYRKGKKPIIIHTE